MKPLAQCGQVLSRGLLALTLTLGILTADGVAIAASKKSTDVRSCKLFGHTFDRYEALPRHINPHNAEALDRSIGALDKLVTKSRRASSPRLKQTSSELQEYWDIVYNDYVNQGRASRENDVGFRVEAGHVVKYCKNTADVTISIHRPRRQSTSSRAAKPPAPTEQTPIEIEFAGFRFDATLRSVELTTQVRGFVAPPGSLFVHAVVEVRSLQSDRPSPINSGIFGIVTDDSCGAFGNQLEDGKCALLAANVPDEELRVPAGGTALLDVWGAYASDGTGRRDVIVTSSGGDIGPLPSGG